MGVDYIPEKDLKAVAWMKHFSAALVENPEIYRTTPEDAAEISALVLAFRIANAKCWPSALRSRVKCRAKNDARKAAERMVRAAAQRIKTDPRIEAYRKVAIGLKPREKRRRHIGPPQSGPVLNITSDISGRIHVRVWDSQSNRRARPKSAVGLQLYERVVSREMVDGSNVHDSSAVTNAGSDEAPPGWRFVGVFTRTPIVLCPATKNPGDAVSVVARWFGRRGEPGPFGDPTSIRVSCVVLRQGALHRDRRSLAA